MTYIAFVALNYPVWYLGHDGCKRNVTIDSVYDNFKNNNINVFERTLYCQDWKYYWMIESSKSNYQADVARITKGVKFDVGH